MKTDDLIRVLVADLPNRGETVRGTLRTALPVGLAFAVLLLVAVIGLRPGLAGLWPVILPKLLVTLALALAALPLALRLTAPEPQPARLFAWLLLPVLVLVGLIALEITRDGAAGLVARAIGQNSLYCLVFVPLLSLGPLAALVLTARQGAVTAPERAGLLAGLAAAGMGASLYALHCTDDSLLFVALWYSLGALLTAGLGTLAFRWAVRW
jgi:hypothetical protein